MDMHRNTSTDTRACFRCMAQKNGRIRETIEERPENFTGPIQIVWHVRVGDIVLHSPHDPFFENVWDTLSQALGQHVTAKHSVYWGPSGGEIQKDFEKKLTALLGNVEFFSVSAGDAILAMMNADILIGSGSSFPLVAMLFSRGPLFLNHEPKRGNAFGAEYTRDSVWLSRDGTIGLHPFVLQVLLTDRFFSRDSKRVKYTVFDGQ